MHTWGDGWEHWDDLWEAERMCEKLARRYRLPARQIKEKFGTLRCYCSLGYYSLHSLTHPCHMYCRYPRWLWVLNCDWLTASKWYWRWFVTIPSVWLHRILYKRMYRKLVEKYPHIEAEITCAADFPELLGKGKK